MRVCFVIAHPDDECYFFGPSVQYFSDIAQTSLLCCSGGEYVANASKLGSAAHEKRQDEIAGTRRSELESSWKLLTNKSSVFFLEKPCVDDPNLVWNKDHLAAQIYDHAVTNHIDVLITFDDRGVSGHANHRACYQAVHRNAPPAGVRVLHLLTCPSYIRYVPCGGWIYAHMGGQLRGRHVCRLSHKEKRRVRRACRIHESQNTLVRWVARYTSCMMQTNVLFSTEDAETVRDIDLQ